MRMERLHVTAHLTCDASISSVACSSIKHECGKAEASGESGFKTISPFRHLASFSSIKLKRRHGDKSQVCTP